jgi:C1A family cysteine protease
MYKMIGAMGWNKNKVDKRDYKFSEPTLKVFPVRSSVETFAPPIKNQGALGSCTAFAACTVLEAIMKHHKIPVKYFAELFLYFIVRDFEGNPGEDTGCEPRDVVKCMAKQGICLQETWPYKISKFTQKPPNKAYLEALDYQILTYESLTTLAQMKTCIASVRHPFMFGFDVYESFDYIGADGIMPMPKKGERILGGHMVTAVGYNDKSQMMTIQNSWGPDWAKGGKFYMPYAFITNPKYASDFTRITRGEQM